MYFFNITNAEVFDNSNRSDIKLLHFQQVGPYVYDEFREKYDVHFDQSGNMVSYKENKTYVFNPKLSGKELNETDELTVIQAAYVCFLLLF